MIDDKQLTEEYLDGKVVFPGKIIRVEHWHVRLPNGETALREVACHPGAAGIVALDDDGNVILVRQHRIAVGRLTLEIPAGKLDHPGEDRAEAARRELREETGLTMHAPVYRGIVDFFCDPWPAERMHLYTCTDFTGTLTDCNEGTLEWVPKPEVENLPIWQGDKIFLRLLAEGAPFFHLELTYHGDTLVQAVLEGETLPCG